MFQTLPCHSESQNIQYCTEMMYFIAIISLLFCLVDCFTVMPSMNRHVYSMRLSDSKQDQSKKPLTLNGLIQLVLMGAGAPGLGDYKGTDENGKMFFELEANNFIDKDGKDMQTRAKFFEKGWVEGSDEAINPPGFFQNLLSGGRLMTEWDEKNRKSK